MEPPKRAFEITVHVGGDTLEDAVRELYHFAESIEGGSRVLCAGGCSSGGYMDFIHDPAMTPELYRAKLTEYLESLKESA